MGLSVQAHYEWEGLSSLLTDGEGRLQEGKITHCNHSQAGREDPGALTQQHDLQLLNAFQVKDCLFKAQQFCCLSSAASRSKKFTRDKLIYMHSEYVFVFRRMCL